MTKYVHLVGTCNSLHAIDPATITRIGTVDERPGLTYLSFMDGSLLEIVGTQREILAKLYVSRIPSRISR